MKADRRVWQQWGGLLEMGPVSDSRRRDRSQLLCGYVTRVFGLKASFLDAGSSAEIFDIVDQKASLRDRYQMSSYASRQEKDECIEPPKHELEGSAEQSMSAQFVKQNHSRYADHLLQEAHGLDALRRAATGTGIDVPEVIRVDHQTLTMPLIRSTRCSADQWARLGQGLASIHARPQTRFGFDEDNYIGLNPQPNAFNDCWGSFFLQQRLEFQVGLIADQRCHRHFSQCLQQNAVRLREFLDNELVSPSFLHGDLWNGNLLCGEDGRIWLIDPAPYYGDPEVDLAMTEMFGGFPAEFYAAYRDRRPEPSTYPLRKRIYNLYHYLNHLNLFGDAYLDDCEAGLTALGKI